MVIAAATVSVTVPLVERVIFAYLISCYCYGVAAAVLTSPLCFYHQGLSVIMEERNSLSLL